MKLYSLYIPTPVGLGLYTVFPIEVKTHCFILKRMEACVLAEYAMDTSRIAGLSEKSIDLTYSFTKFILAHRIHYS